MFSSKQQTATPQTVVLLSLKIVHPRLFGSFTRTILVVIMTKILSTYLPSPVLGPFEQLTPQSIVCAINN